MSQIYERVKKIQSFNVLEKSYEDNATFLSQFLLSYLSPIFVKGYSGAFTHEDLGLVANQDKCSLVFNAFVVNWENELKLPENKRSLWKVLWKSTGYLKLTYALSLYAIYAASQFGPVLILNALTNYLQGTKHLDTATLWILVVLLFVIPMIGSVASAQSNVITAHIGLQMRNILINAIYRKSLRLSPASRQKSSTGQIINMFSNDTAQIQRFLFFLNNCALAPFQIMISIILIWFQVGVSVFVGFAVIVVLFPINIFLFKLLAAFRTKKVKVTDVRVKLMNEILSGIRVIKNYAWEQAFKDKIMQIRNKELIILKQLAYIMAIGLTFVLMAAPAVQPIVIFYTYIKLGNQLDAATAFTCIALFNLMQFPFSFLPLGLAQYSQSIVSTKRMLDFFTSQELDPYIDRSDDKLASDGFVVVLENVSTGWVPESDLHDKVDIIVESNNKKDKTTSNKDNKEYEMVNTSKPNTNANGDILVNRAVYTINDITTHITRGQLVAVVGSVGSGKSSFLSTLLGELHLQKGYVRVIGSVAYCDQKPWIINATVKENILFGKEFDEKKFNEAIEAANLLDDIKVLPGGILTEIGERGINLSGGQKARVALARAVYCDSDVYLLDDPLSAVDAHVGQHIFHECIVKTLANKTRILVTHHVHLLQHCDTIIVLEDGTVKATGSYNYLTTTLGLDISNLIPQVEQSNDEPSEKIVDVMVPNDGTIENIQINLENELTSRSRSSSLASQIRSSIDTRSHTNSVDISAKPLDMLAETKDHDNESIKPSKSNISTKSQSNSKKDNRSSNLMTIEEKNLGDVSRETYVYYIKAGGIWLFSIVVFFLCAGQGLQVASSFWLSIWGTESINQEIHHHSYLSISRNIYYLNIYAVFSMLYLFTYTVRSLFLAQLRLGTSVVLHEDLLTRVLKAPVSFFDVTPLGRILNRFSSDLLTVDEELSQTINQVTNSLFGCIGALVAIAASTKGTFLVLLPPLVYVYNIVQKYFRKTNTNVARMESISRSPIYADFSQALTGMSSIRAYHKTDQFIKHLESMVDRNSIANITSQNASQWLAIRLDFLGSIITLFIAVIAIAAKGFIPASYMALGLSYSFQLTTLLKFCVRMLAQFEAQMNSVERIMHYSQNVEQEGQDNQLDPSQIPSDWPSEGKITGDNIQMRYRDGPLVLKGINFYIQSNEKIGIAGRTGSGKSSMMIALFRIQELAAGSIFIDGLDISKVPLHILRSKLGIIPQDPVMFSASIRFNLDPFNQHTDLELWDVLERINLKNHVLSLPNQLFDEVAEGGDNFSAGQRQLVCIARALLRHPKILVLDEATASIDNETDALVQNMVKEQFKSSTVLTIAHRLNTIIDSDRIMILEMGNLVEFNSAEELLKIENGVFKQLWTRHQTETSQ